MQGLTLALDWTPNINHIGFFVAHDLGLYAQRGIQLSISNPVEDHYQMTPGKKLELGRADFAIAPFETVISLNNKANKVDAVAVYAILQEDLSSIVTLADSAIDSPSQLDSKSYASYKARYEDHIVRQLIKNDQGQGNLNIIYPNKLGIWNTLLEGKADSTWIFDNWEGVEAEAKGVRLHKFKMQDYGIPYGYSPVILTKMDAIKKNKEVYQQFIQGTKEGFLFAKKDPQAAVAILRKYVTDYDLHNVDLDQSLQVTAPFFGDENTSGIMQAERVQAFTKWLVDNGLEEAHILQQTLYSNELLVN